MRVFILSIILSVLLSSCIKDGSYLSYVISGINEKDVVSIMVQTGTVHNDSLNAEMCSIWTNRRAKPKPIRLGKLYLKDSDGWCTEQRLGANELAQDYVVSIGNRQIKEKMYLVKPLEIGYTQGEEGSDTLFAFSWAADSLTDPMHVNIIWWPQDYTTFTQIKLEVQDHGYFALTKEHLKEHPIGHGEISFIRSTSAKIEDKKYDLSFSSSSRVDGLEIDTID